MLLKAVQYIRHSLCPIQLNCERGSGSSHTINRKTDEQLTFFEENPCWKATILSTLAVLLAPKCFRVFQLGSRNQMGMMSTTGAGESWKATEKIVCQGAAALWPIDAVVVHEYLPYHKYTKKGSSAFNSCMRHLGRRWILCLLYSFYSEGRKYCPWPRITASTCRQAGVHATCFKAGGKEPWSASSLTLDVLHYLHWEKCGVREIQKK